MTKVSICIITYNQEQYIRQCVASVLMQKCTVEFEVIVGDDGSSDATAAILAEMADLDSRIRLIRSDVNRGVKRNLFSVLSEATGDFVALLEGDDYWCDENKLQLQIEALRSNPGAHLCATSVRTEVKFFGFNRGRRVRPFDMDPKEIRASVQTGRINLHTCTLFFTRFFIEEHLGSPLYRADLLSGDGPLLIHAAFFGDIIYLPICTATYRIAPGSLMNSRLDVRKRLVLETVDWQNLYRQYFGISLMSNEELSNNIEKRMLLIGFAKKEGASLDLNGDLSNQFVFAWHYWLYFSARRYVSRIMVWALGEAS